MSLPPKPQRRATVAIIGGGPGGLLTAYYLRHAYPAPVDITVFEASGRTGGKVVTNRFDGTGVPYEAGAAELYDYSAVGPDPLRELIAELGLTTYPMDGRAVFIGDQLVASDADVGRVLGPAAGAALAAFARRGRGACSPEEYYESDWQSDNVDPLARQTFEQLLATVPDPAARHYIEASVHSDVATEPRHTSAAYGLQNYLMNEPGYMRLYGIDGGLERLPRAIAAKLSATVRLNARVTRVTGTADDRYTLTIAGEPDEQTFDYCVAALPSYWLPAIDWQPPTLARAMAAHHAHHDYPAHYLRVTVLFRKPFWREVVSGSWFMLDALGGCCVYDESARCPGTPGAAAALGWLIGGSAAVTLSNLDDRTIVARVLEELPAPLRHGRELVVDGRVHRWVGAVNGRPGGFPLREPDGRHVPAPDLHPSLFVVGDYLFDSTLNGVADSADCVAAWIAEEEEPDDAVQEIAPAESPREVTV
jgi:protoporphyrinogen oxidase